ncbi:hypothetical protein [Frankia gtarii]|uniref:hypothetical protein n=1 Tax=Frankia gtarii TaxID=2950102 RepID=UPI0021C22CBC|nr:hypothetical protein [Frankia gtarii]
MPTNQDRPADQDRPAGKDRPAGEDRAAVPPPQRSGRPSPSPATPTEFTATTELAALRRRLGMPDVTDSHRARSDPQGGQDASTGAREDDRAAGTGPGRDRHRGRGLDRDPALYSIGRSQPARERHQDPDRRQDPDRSRDAESGPRRGRLGESQAAAGHRQGHGYGHGREFGPGLGRDSERTAGRAWDPRGEAPEGEPGSREADPARRVEPFDHERTQIIRGLRGRRVPGPDSFRSPHAPIAEGLIPMYGTMTGEFFLGGLNRPDPAAGGPGVPAAIGGTPDAPGGGTAVVDRAEPADYGLADLSEDAGSGGRHRVERTTRGSSRSRAIWTLVDQVLSSGTNAVMSFIIARSVSPSEFGAFGVAFAIFSLMIGFSKAAGTAPLGIKFADVSPRVFRAAGAAGTGTAFVIGLFSGVVTLVVGLALGGGVGDSLIAMGLVFPALLLQDAWRQVFFAEGRPAAAAANDGIWAIVQFGAIFLLIIRDVSTSWAMLLAWGGAAAVAAVLGIFQAGFRPATNQARSWIAEHRDINGYMSAEYLTVQGAQQASTLLLGTLGAIDLVGALRGVQTLLGPTTILAVGIVSWAIPEFSRRKDMSAGARLRAAYALSGVIVTVGAIWGTVFLFLPASIGHSLLGDTWGQTHHLLALSIVQQAGPAATVGPACMLYAMGQAKLTFRANAVLAPQLLAYPIIGLELGGATGAVVGYIAAFWITVPYWFLLVRRVAREAEPDGTTTATKATATNATDATDATDATAKGPAGTEPAGAKEPG